MNVNPISAQLQQLYDGTTVRTVQPIQSLWGGYGAIYRVELCTSPVTRLIVKAVQPPTKATHPRGWGGERSHSRKLRSYAVERTWYLDFASRCGSGCRVPKLHHERCSDNHWLFVFEDLNDAGFAERRAQPSSAEVHACLDWLASFHAKFLGVSPTGLWPVGTYWHLATRPDELQAIRDNRLKAAAALIDQRLNACRFKTLVHGDAKAANFCFPNTDGPVAAVDFQYVGGGCGIKDVVYLLSSCVAPSALHHEAEHFLSYYFSQLRHGLSDRLTTIDMDALETEWRALYPFAWADFYRFLAGWAPSHWKIDTYSRQLTTQVLDSLP